MRFSEHDQSVLRGLASKKMEIANLPIQKENWALWTRLNQLEAVKPMVWINEVCWQEMEGIDELDLNCADPFCRDLETALRRELYQWAHFRGDMIVEDVMYCPVVIHDSGFGIAEHSKKVHVYEGAIASRQFEPGIQDPEDVEKIKMPELAVDWEATERNYEAMNDLFGDLIRVETRGVPGRWFAPWDELIRWWGVEEALMDLVVRPEMVHAAMDRLVSAYLHRLDQWEELNVLALNNGPIRVGSGGYGCTNELPGEAFDSKRIRAKNLWGCATAQIFSEVSPEMHEEFALHYERRWLDRFGLTYYGCCEPLHLKMDMLKRVPNLRKISCSPWADVARMAEKTGGNYVISFKPNPAFLAEETWDRDRVRAYLADALEKARGCAIEVILKDISTIRFDPGRLEDWSEIMQDVI